MATKELAIRIPEDKYDRLMQTLKLDPNYSGCEITELKKHGDLVDLTYAEDNFPEYWTDDDGSKCFKISDLLAMSVILEATK